MTVFRMFAVSHPGLEEITLRELEGLGIEGKPTPGGVEFKGTLEELYRTNLWLRTANRVLVRVAIFKATTFAELVERVSRYPWEIYIREDVPVKFRVTSRKSKLYHTKAIEERVIKGIMKRVKFRPLMAEEEDEGESVIVRVERDRFTISVNSSGAMLHKRGYREKASEAPLRENLAAAIILAGGWDGKTPLIDPFCGSGTIPIEAALICTNRAPGIDREFAFEKWKIHDQQLWEKVKEEALNAVRECTTPIVGVDIDEKAISAAVENSFRAKVYHNIRFVRGSFPAVEFKEAFVVSNPPYGVRLSSKNIEETYSSLGRWIRENFKRAHIVILSPLKRYIEATGLELERRLTFSNGGIRVGLYVGEV